VIGHGVCIQRWLRAKDCIVSLSVLFLVSDHRLSFDRFLHRKKEGRKKIDLFCLNGL